MAIKVNGTTVIDDSRNATNLANVTLTAGGITFSDNTIQTTAATGSGSGSTGGGNDKVFVENDIVITSNYTLGQSSRVSGVTVTIASPAVFTLTSHGFVAGQPISFSTTGALPTGLDTTTVYYVISTGLSANAFRVSTTSGGSAVNTSGSQSGTHSVGKVKSATTLGPVTILNSANITIPSGARWLIL